LVCRDIGRTAFLWRLGGGDFYFMREIPEPVKETFDHLKLPIEEKKACDCNVELH